MLQAVVPLFRHIPSIPPIERTNPGFRHDHGDSPGRRGVRGGCESCGHTSRWVAVVGRPSGERAAGTPVVLLSSPRCREAEHSIPEVRGSSPLVSARWCRPRNRGDTSESDRADGLADWRRVWFPPLQFRYQFAESIPQQTITTALVSTRPIPHSPGGITRDRHLRLLGLPHSPTLRGSTGNLRRRPRRAVPNQRARNVLNPARLSAYTFQDGIHIHRDRRFPVVQTAYSHPIAHMSRVSSEENLFISSKRTTFPEKT